ncbi:MAG: hypothetical protein JSS86_03230 [Cyanobacteria bacterium SZAS LIN-2]|nr:hypothetical protein [Cyanobacteria bacterium SZAS LIN-3]MBS1995291.1 hypothetical protein [Cyanobacteria bacterium SZAS LIN-2]
MNLVNGLLAFFILLSLALLPYVGSNSLPYSAFFCLLLLQHANLLIASNKKFTIGDRFGLIFANPIMGIFAAIIASILCEAIPAAWLANTTKMICVIDFVYCVKVIACSLPPSLAVAARQDLTARIGRR